MSPCLLWYLEEIITAIFSINLSDKINTLLYCRFIFC